MTFSAQKKLSLIFLLIVFVFFTVKKIKAGGEHNVSGWAWSDNIGWISFNNTTDGSSVNYGVNIDGSTGLFSGYAWSDNIGWISFNETELTGCPSGTCRAELSFSTNEVSGWAKVLNTVAGWDGWISLRGTNYGVSLNDTTNELEGWAWSDDFGWISFNHLNCDPNNDGVSDGIGNCPPAGTPISDYKVTWSFVVTPTGGLNTDYVKVTADVNFPPNKPQMDGETFDCCWAFPQALLGTSVIFHWSYSDPEGDPQAQYEIWVDDDSDFGDTLSLNKFNILVQHTPLPGPDFAYTLSLNDDAEGDWLSQLAWSTTYYWKVRVKDNISPGWSDWSDVDLFATRGHANPYVDFAFIPQSPTVGEVIEFIQDDPVIAQSLCYDTSGNEFPCQEDTLDNIDYAWDFESDSIIDSYKEGNASTTYSQRGLYDVTLRITDKTLPSFPINNYCEHTITVNIGLSLPEWKEISP